MTVQEAIKKLNSLHYKILRTSFCNKVYEAEIEALVMAKKVLEQPRADKWIPCSERLPEDDNYILVSFENYTLPDIARYEEDEKGGAFYPGDEDKSYASFGLFVNAWQPLPEPYRECDTPCT